MTQKEIIERPSSIAFISANWNTMPNKAMAAHLGVCIQYVREVSYNLGLYRMRLEYWTPEQISFLKKNYKKCGDKELAEIFQTKWPKQKGWTLKHIEKKRMYLNLKRTPTQVRKIKEKHKANGVYIASSKKTWATRGAAPDGSILVWNSGYNKTPVKYIKVNGKYLFWYHYLWQQDNRSIKKGFNIVARKGVTEVITVDDLEQITNAELSRRNSQKSCIGLYDNYIAGILTHGDPDARKFVKENPQILQLKRNQLLMNRAINSQLKSITNATRKSN